MPQQHEEDVWERLRRSTASLREKLAEIHEAEERAPVLRLVYSRDPEETDEPPRLKPVAS